jgi:hypothetical protein
MAQTPLLDEQKSNTIALWDRVGIGASTLCLSAATAAGSLPGWHSRA